MKNILLISIVLALALASCKTSSEIKTTTNTTTESITEDKKIIYDMIVSFASAGEGIKRDLKKELDTTIDQFNETNNTTVVPEKLGWGREGEVDYLFNLKNLSTKQKKAIKANIKAIVGSEELILISYDQKSVHKR